VGEGVAEGEKKQEKWGGGGVWDARKKGRTGREGFGTHTNSSPWDEQRADRPKMVPHAFKVKKGGRLVIGPKKRIPV